jgi:transposase InsO family protein
MCSCSSSSGRRAAVPAGLELRTDHGPQYTGQDCAELLARGDSRTLAPVGRPTGNAVVERLIRTMKEEVIRLQDWGRRRGIACGARGVAAPLQRDATAPGPRLADAGGVPPGEAGRGDGRGRVSEKPARRRALGVTPAASQRLSGALRPSP